MKLDFEINNSVASYTANDSAYSVDRETAQAKVSQMLQAGIKAAQEGNRAEARQLLVQVTEADPKNEAAWLWMASISEYPEELIVFLNNVLSLNPGNARALEWMKATKSLLAKTFVERGSDAARDANKDFAKQCFWQAIAHDDQNEAAWMSLASITDSPDGKILHLQKALAINPANETAKSLLNEAKNQTVETLLRKANSAAVAGEREMAREMLQEVLKDAPELEEAWILKAYLAETFSEKIVCYEKVLMINPENEMAISGLASLRETMAKAEAKRAEQAALIAQAMEEVPAENDSDSTGEEAAAAFSETDDISPTQELIFPSVLMNSEDDFQPMSAFQFTNENAQAASQKNNENFGGMPMNSTESSSGFSAFENPNPTYNDFHPQEDNASPDEFAANHESAQPVNPTFNYYSSNAETPVATENFNAHHISKSSLETVACPFCSAENEPNAFVCGSCRTILTLSDVEMLLANTEADQEILRQAVGRMEAEKESRPFSAAEFKNLAIGHINLKNLRQGVMYLQKAAQMTPNDVMLYSQVNSLKIRLSEIEQQENSHNAMAKGRKILVIDDSATVRKLISSKLEKSGHEVVSAVDGIDALEKIKEFVPDLILLDIMMPQLDGYQVCKLIRTNEATKDVPVVMISGKDGFFDKVRGRMAGTTGYITKPFGPETLMKTIETYIVHKDQMPDVETDEMNG